MSFVLIASAGTDSLHVRGWRVPRAQVAALASAGDVLRSLQVRRDEAARQAEAALAQARAAGFNAGLCDGRRAAEAEADAALGSVSSALHSLDLELRRRVGDLALEVMRRIVGQVGWEALVPEMAAQALGELIDSAPFAVRVHPALQARVAQRLAEGGGRLRVLADEALAPDDCIFETPQGRVHAGLARQLAGVADAFAAVAPGGA
jgi:flagellar assembly protein FliH